MSIQTKKVDLTSKHTDEQAIKIAAKLTTTEIFTIYYIDSFQSRMLRAPTLAELKKEHATHGNGEKEFLRIRDSFVGKLIIEIGPNNNEINFTPSGEHIFKKLGELNAHHRK